jgi:hypothetical protein
MGLEIPRKITGKKPHYWQGGTGVWFSYLKQEKG